ncbi:AlpA family phage regulatory protein [Shewanella yunxiaonensis]|uniref:AlpA family phage regulatory protein n=1 Tax=Shewanella yunxiaonensis TaxID=2829809 RepID=A0ABX7YQ91_9GAMM|nr:AlpA family phage regulatory protein [Shewanella yunxiaonensis]QUN04777.1 AlpA family phage regulatory protein [Shewanella yunxiaonensis]
MSYFVLKNSVENYIMLENSMRVVRKPEVKNLLGISHSTLHERINEGLLPKPFRLSGRAVGWYEYEIQYILSALAAEVSDSALADVVNTLIKKRKEAWASLRQ